LATRSDPPGVSDSVKEDIRFLQQRVASLST